MGQLAAIFRSCLVSIRPKFLRLDVSAMRAGPLSALTRYAEINRDPDRQRVTSSEQGKVVSRLIAIDRRRRADYQQLLSYGVCGQFAV